jgi:hypothetical protein
MEFTLVYEGPLKSNGGPKEKQTIRRILHPQFELLWQQPPLSHFARYLEESPSQGELSVIRRCGAFRFAPVVTDALRLLVELDIAFLRPGPPGVLITGGDIDNRIKTLLDALRMPHTIDELPRGDSPDSGEDPFYCLLEDDSLITRISVNADRLLRTTADPASVLLVIRVRTRAIAMIWGNMGLG